MRTALALLLLSVPALARSAEVTPEPQLRPFTSLVPLMPLSPEDVPEYEVGLPWLPEPDRSEAAAQPAAPENGYLVEGLSVCEGPTHWGVFWDGGCSGTARHLSLHGFILRLALARISEDPAGYVMQDEDWSWRVLPDAQ